MEQNISLAGILLGFTVLTVAVAPAVAQGVRSADKAATRCDTASAHADARVGLATMAAYDHPFTGVPASGGRMRHAVLSGAEGSVRGRVTRGRRVHKDGGEVVAKDRRPVAARPDSTAWCPQLAAMPGSGGGGVTGEVPVLPNTGSAPGEVLPSPQLPGSVARQGTRFFLPPLLGGAFLGGGAIALANRPGESIAQPSVVPVTPVVPIPVTPVVPIPPTTPPLPPLVPATPTAPLPVTPGNSPVPPTPPTPVLPALPSGPVVPTSTVPEPTTVALLAAGLAVFGIVEGQRQRVRR